MLATPEMDGAIPAIACLVSLFAGRVWLISNGTVDHQYFFGPQRHPVPGYGIHTPTWADLEATIADSLTCHHPKPAEAEGNPVT